MQHRRPQEASRTLGAGNPHARFPTGSYGNAERGKVDLPMRLVILGIGAIGGVVGGLLARTNREVALLARGAQLAAIRAQGLRIETPDTSFVVKPLVADSGEPFAWLPGDVLVLATKTQDAATALRDLAVPPEIPIGMPDQRRRGRTDCTPPRPRGLRRMRDDAGDLPVARRRARVGDARAGRDRYRSLSRRAR